MNRNKKPLRPKTVDNYRRFAEYLEDWLDKPLGDITGDMVEVRHKQIRQEVAERKHGPLSTGNASANMAMTVLRLVWRHIAAQAQGKFPAADADGVRPPCPTEALRKDWCEVEDRTRHIKLEDLPAFYKAVMALESATQRDYLRLVLFTGLRLNEAAALTWDEVNLSERTILLPRERTKANRTLHLPLSDYLHDFLVARRALGKAGRWVFPASSTSGHIVDLKFALWQVAESSGVERVSVHDLRRTFILVAQRHVTAFEITSLVNHAKVSQTERYYTPTVDDLREPMQKVTDALKSHIGLEGPQGNVEKLSTV